MFPLYLYLSNLTREELINVAYAYDEYVAETYDPVSILDFINSELSDWYGAWRR